MEHRIIMSECDALYMLKENHIKLLFGLKDFFLYETFLIIREKQAIKKIVIINNSRYYMLVGNAMGKTKRSVCCLIVNWEKIKNVIQQDELIERYVGGCDMTEREIQLQETAEEKMSYSNDDLYNINSWGADLSFREILIMYGEKELVKPELQRKYVWSKVEASRFIDSILLGLPVPSVFFAKEQDETMLIIDGFQRIMTVNDYVEGIFSGDGKIFKLSNTENINARWRGKAFAELEPEEKRRIKNTTIHAIIFEQKYPKNDTGMFQIFERINTGGRTLKAQEIRNCVYQGKCNDLLFKLNVLPEWREILDLESEDSRMQDLELILRYFAMRDLHCREEGKLKQINLAKYLNEYMSDKTHAADEEITQMEKEFKKTFKVIRKIFGKYAFRNLRKGTDLFAKKINPAIFDAITVSTSFVIKSGYCYEENIDYITKYKELLQDETFRQTCSNRTTNVENIKTRIMLASQFIYGVDYEW